MATDLMRDDQLNLAWRSRPSRRSSTGYASTLPPSRQGAIPPAVILAAGSGSRLRADVNAVPKPLTLVAGTSLLERTIIVCRDAGVRDIILVVGFGRAAILPALAGLGARHHVRITAVVNEDWILGNGSSVLASRPHVGSRFFLMMCDHIVEPQFLTRLLEQDDGERGCAVVVDRQPELVPDLPEATKVRISGDRVIAIGKTLLKYDAVDTCVFLCRSPLFRALQDSAERERHTLSDAVQLLASQGEVGWVDCEGLHWIDVDTAEDLHRAEKLIEAPMQLAGGTPPGMAGGQRTPQPWVPTSP